MRRSTADILPECLIQKILSFLSYKEAAKMSILSKTWLIAWFNHPYLEFTIPYHGVSSQLVDTIMERYRHGNIPIDKFELSYNIISQAVIPMDKWLDIALHNGVKDLVIRVANFSFPTFTILAAKSLRELVLWGCDLKCVSSTNGVPNCNSLRKLSLSSVSLDEINLQTLINSCSSIVTFILEDCRGLEKIELLNLQKIKSVSIKTRRNQLVKIQIPTLEHLRYHGCRWKKLDIAECQNLKSLDISSVTIANGCLQNLISGCQYLKVLKIHNCEGIREIDAPNLVSLEYEGDEAPELKIAKESSRLKHPKVVLKCYNDLDAPWFCKLRKFLSNSTSWSQVSLYISKCNDINMEDLQLHHRVAITQVDVLNVDTLWINEDCTTLVDALLWSCRPKRLNLHSTKAAFTCFINQLIYMKNLSHSPFHEIEPWHSQLKEVQVYKFDEKSQSWRPKELKRGELSTMTISERVEYFFLLDW